MRVVFNWDYHSSLGTAEKGDEADLEEYIVEALNRDSPGVVSPVQEKQQERQQPLASNRQVTRSSNRRA